MENRANLAIIGGTGIYDPGEFRIIEKLDISTPYGEPSTQPILCELVGIDLIFLPRHGEKHTIPPHKVNYRANIYALKELGVKRILAPQAVGSLKEELRPGVLVFPDQFIDFTKKRDYSFYDGPEVVHIACGEPFCPELRAILSNTSRELGLEYFDKATSLCIEGPRFSTKAESNLFRQFADIVGMTLIPEAKLARELEICYAPISMVTDYDVWKEKEEVSADKVIETMRKNTAKVKQLIINSIPKIPKQRNCICSRALEGARL